MNFLYVSIGIIGVVIGFVGGLICIEFGRRIERSKNVTGEQCHSPSRKGGMMPPVIWGWLAIIAVILFIYLLLRSVTSNKSSKYYSYYEHECTQYRCNQCSEFYSVSVEHTCKEG